MRIVVDLVVHDCVLFVSSDHLPRPYCGPLRRLSRVSCLPHPHHPPCSAVGPCHRNGSLVLYEAVTCPTWPP